MVSFFATDTLMWIIIIFFTVELSLRYLIMKNMNFETQREKRMEWIFWWLDVIATIVMIPAFAVIPYGGALRMMRLVRLLRPWVVILKNLRDVMREGQFMQEINLIVLVLAVISIAGGIFGKFLLPGFDFTQDGTVDPQDDNMIARIWFSFRLFTDPGNSVTYPDNASIAVFSIVAVVIGVFIFAFFIGIGASIVSDLMVKLRNEKLAVTRHMVMFGWNDVAPYIITHLRLASERSFSRIKLVLLQESAQIPDILLEEKWVTYRTGNSKHIEDLKRVNLSAARQALVLIPDDKNSSETLSESFFSLLAIRKMHPDIYVSIAMPGMSEPRIPEHQHMLQVGWDDQGKYDKPTVILPAADFRANAFKNILQYSDFDQVVSRLMIPERTEESALQVCEWPAKICYSQDETQIFTPDGQHSVNIINAAQNMLKRGVTLLAVIDEQWGIIPLYRLPKDQEIKITAVVGIAINENSLHGELSYALHRPTPIATTAQTFNISLCKPAPVLRLLITGWVNGLPLLLKRLLPDYQHIEVVLLDDLPTNTLADKQIYIERRLKEKMGSEKITVSVKHWDFSNMEVLREYVESFTHILLSQPQASKQEPYTVISTMLSHIVSMVQAEQCQLKIYPVLSDRNQARLLQEELDGYTLPVEVHLIVPNEFYGAYVAHTSFHMYTAENNDVYQMKRVLRHVIHDLMSEDGNHDALELYTMDVHETLPDSPEAIYASLLAQGFIWIGYRLNNAFSWDDPVQNMIRSAFPREGDFHCLRQHQIIINPFGNPISRRSWEHSRDDIAELIVIGENITTDAEKSSA